MIRFFLFLLPLFVWAQDPAVKLDDWNGYKRQSFVFDGRPCFLVEPKTAAPGKPWIWRARFFGHRPEVDLALLDKGFHLAYMDVVEMLGNREAVAHWNAFYDLLITKHGLAKKPALEGMSRGGLYIYSWAAANPDKVACMYADAPVCDIKSWPVALRNGAPEPRAWQMVVNAFGFKNEQDLRQYKGSPVDILEPIAKAKIPLLHVTGDADDVVPMSENTRVVEQRYKALGGEITVIVKPGIGHKHGLDDPTPIIQFILRNTLDDKTAVVPQFEDGDTITFIGDSITHSRKWHKYIYDYYLTRFPNRKLNLLNAGISGDSAGGALRRLDFDILPGKPNVATIMFGMNDVSRGLYAPEPADEARLAARKKALDAYKSNMEQLVARLQQNGVRRLVFATPSPFDDTAKIETPNLPGVNEALRQAGLFVRELAARSAGAVVDFNGPMTALNLQRQQANPAYTLIGADRVHPGEAGMLVMAYLFLKAQDVPALVSKLTIDTQKDSSECIRCRVSNATRSASGIAFDLLESSLPFPVEDAAKEALQLVAVEAQLDQEMLTVSALAAGSYQLLIDENPAGEFSADALRKGVNLAFNSRTPQFKQAQQVSAMNEERRKLASSLRDVELVELRILRPAKIPDTEAARNEYLDKYQTSSDYYKAMIARYRKLKPEASAMKVRIEELTKSLYEINKPKLHRYELKKLAP